MKFMEKLTSFRQLMVVIILGIAAFIAEFALKQANVAYGIIIFVGVALIFIMTVEMIETFRDGMYGVDILAVTAIIATLFVGEYWATWMLALMITGGGALEEYANDHASRELQALLDNNPQKAHVVKGNEVLELAVEDVKVGDIVLVKANELVPVDGELITENARLDQSQLTGESLPVNLELGDEVMSGSLNQESSFRIKALKEAKDSEYQQLVKLVEESKERPSNFVRIADRYAIPFTIIAYAIAFVAWFVSKDVVRFAEVLVVASPCPLLLSAPIAMISGMSRASGSGIIVKTGTILENMATAKSIAFDKTGTITAGNLVVEEVKVSSDRYSDEDLIKYAASVEQESPHILARSIVKKAKEDKFSLFEVENVQEVTAQGVEGRIDGKLVKVGKAEFVGAKNVDTNKTSIFVSIDGEYVGYIGFADQIRPESKNTIQRLQKLGINNIMMLTGDKKDIAENIAEKAGVPTVHAELLPQDKIDMLYKISEEQRPIVMVGDGVNDAPALAVADIGIAMGAHGATAASETADAVIVKDDLSKVVDLSNISKRTLSVARSSVLVGIIFFIGLMFIAAFGFIPAFWGAVAQEGLDIVSMLLALRARSAGNNEV